MKTSGLCFLLFSLSLLPACSRQQIYDVGQQMEQSRCVDEPAVNYQQCLEKAGMSYNEYVKLREESNQEHP